MRKGRDGGKTGGEKGEKKEKTDENSGHYVIASSRQPERRPMERRTLAPISIARTFSKLSSSSFISNHERYRVRSKIKSAGYEIWNMGLRLYD